MKSKLSLLAVAMVAMATAISSFGATGPDYVPIYPETTQFSYLARKLSVKDGAILTNIFMKGFYNQRAFQFLGVANTVLATGANVVVAADHDTLKISGTTTNAVDTTVNVDNGNGFGQLLILYNDSTNGNTFTFPATQVQAGDATKTNRLSQGDWIPLVRGECLWLYNDGFGFREVARPGSTTITYNNTTVTNLTVNNTLTVYSNLTVHGKTTFNDYITITTNVYITNGGNIFINGTNVPTVNPTDNYASYRIDAAHLGDFPFYRVDDTTVIGFPNAPAISFQLGTNLFDVVSAGTENDLHIYKTTDGFAAAGYYTEVQLVTRTNNGSILLANIHNSTHNQQMQWTVGGGTTPDLSTLWGYDGSTVLVEQPGRTAASGSSFAVYDYNSAFAQTNTTVPFAIWKNAGTTLLKIKNSATFPNDPSYSFDGSGGWTQTASAAAVSPDFTTLTDGATITWTVTSTRVNNATVTLGGNRTLAITGAATGYQGVLIVKQDGTGTRTLTLPGTSKVIGGGSGAVTLTATASAVDILSFYYDGSNYYWTSGLNFN